MINLAKIKNAKTLRCSSWDTSGRNRDGWTIKPGETRVLADINGTGCINHIWMGQSSGYRDVLIKIYWDDEKYPSVLCPLGDFFGLGHEIVNSYQSLLFSVSTNNNNQFNQGCALNSYVQMPFRKSARIELSNEGNSNHGQYFYIDYELYKEPFGEDIAYFHTQWRRENPCDGWEHGIGVNMPEADIVNKECLAWDNNYVILDAKGRGHYIGCNLSVTNFRGDWWGEGDDMIWVDGYKWPPDLHGTGSEDYFNQAWGMQSNAFLRNGSSVFEGAMIRKNNAPWAEGSYQTSYIFHIENPVRFQKEIKVTIEHGHGNHLSNEYSSVAYWYQIEPHRKFGILPVKKRKPVKRTMDGKWIIDKSSQTPHRAVELNAEMKKMKAQWGKKQK